MDINMLYLKAESYYYKIKNGYKCQIFISIPQTQIVFTPTRERGVLGKI